MKIEEIRRENLRKLVKERGNAKLSRDLGYKQPTLITQIAGPNPTRPLSEKNARNFEKTLGLPDGYFDKANNLTASAVPIASRTQSHSDIDRESDVISNVILSVGQLLAEEEVNLPSDRLAKLNDLFVRDAREHGGEVRVDHLLRVIRLLK